MGLIYVGSSVEYLRDVKVNRATALSDVGQPLCRYP